MSRKHEAVSVTVVKTGTVYEVKDVPKELKDVVVTVAVSDDDVFVGNYDTRGWVEGGDVTFIVADDYTNQLVAYQEAQKGPQKDLETP